MAERGGYEAAGVSIERGERATDLMRSAVEGTHGPEVLGAPGGFAGLYALAGYEDPVLASTIDGVGTKVLADAGISYADRVEGLDRPVGEVYLEPHRAYVRAVEALRETVEVRGMAHITGGGLVGNLPRALGGLGARLDPGSWNEPGVFGLIRSLGGVPEEEMRKVFNLGVGFCAVVSSGEAQVGLDTLRGVGCGAWRIGEVTQTAGVEFA